MGFLDNLKERMGLDSLRGNYYEDDYYEDDEVFEDDEYNSSSYRRDRGQSREDAYGAQEDTSRSGSGLLGNTPRRNAESVSVYTRSGRYVDANAETDKVATPIQYPTSSLQKPDSYATSATSYRAAATQGASDSQEQTSYSDVLSSAHLTPGDIGLTPVARSSAKLPPYVLKPKSYEDVQVMVSRVRTNQPVVLDFASTRMDTAKRILDYSFGYAAGINGEVRELGDRCFAVLPYAVELTSSELSKLQSDGVIRG